MKPIKKFRIANYVSPRYVRRQGCRLIAHVFLFLIFTAVCIGMCVNGSSGISVFLIVRILIGIVCGFFTWAIYYTALNTMQFPSAKRPSGGIGYVPLHILSGHSEFVSDTSWSPNGEFLASCAYDDAIWLWKLDDGSGHCLGGHKNTIVRIVWSPHGRLLASASIDKTIRIWDIQASTVRYVFTDHTKVVNDVVWSADGNTLISCSDDSTVKLWDISSGQPLYTFSFEKQGIDSLALSSDGKTLVAFCYAQKELYVLDLPSKQFLNTFSFQDNGSVACISLSPNGKMLACGTTSSTILLWHMETRELSNKLEGHTASITCLAWIPEAHGMRNEVTSGNGIN